MGISQVTTGILRIEDAGTNCYVLEHDDALVFVDAGLPRTWRFTHEALRRIGREWADVTDIVVTHAHFDHIGFAAKAQREFGVRVWVHPEDHRIAAHPYRYQPGRPRLLYPLLHPGSIPVLGSMVRAGALRVPGVDAIEDLAAAQPPAGLRVRGADGLGDLAAGTEALERQAGCREPGQRLRVQVVALGLAHDRRVPRESHRGEVLQLRPLELRT